ncbi:hypothetical protein O6H91_01G138200 [Diphasiastrum complanatum]|uniref:Uncharacterized protein n=1 Tax=Diphasiastrum complanatum TaxID=34168 RepID=A0ACC2EWY5_DIPCM|nr:hypothetical protein O6H91_01G138200 [Diphasiastrum complanatum]
MHVLSALHQGPDLLKCSDHHHNLALNIGFLPHCQVLRFTSWGHGLNHQLVGDVPFAHPSGLGCDFPVLLSRRLHTLELDRKAAYCRERSTRLPTAHRRQNPTRSSTKEQSHCWLLRNSNVVARILRLLGEQNHCWLGVGKHSYKTFEKRFVSYRNQLAHLSSDFANKVRSFPFYSGYIPYNS